MQLNTISKQQQVVGDEVDRIQAVDSYSILDTLPEKQYDDITKLTAFICQTPVSLITIMDKDRNWYKSITGNNNGVSQTPRKDSFCRITIQQNDLLEVSNTTLDKRFNKHPDVIGGSKVRFYAGYPLINKDGHKIGALCIIDTVPRELTLEQKEALRTLSNQVVFNFELKKRAIELEINQEELLKNNHKLDKFAHIVSHDLKSPLKNIISLNHLAQVNPENTDLYLEKIGVSISRMENMIDGVLAFAKSNKKHLPIQKTNTYNVVKEIIENFPDTKTIQFEVNPNLPIINTQTVLLTQVLQNLIENAIKYHNKEGGKVDINFSYIDNRLIFSISDDGPGIPKRYQKEIFEPFKRLISKDEVEGSGIGLAFISDVLNERSDKIWVESNPTNSGVTFSFSWN